MKKLVIAAAIVCAAAFSYGVDAYWNLSTGSTIMHNGSVVADNTVAYLMFSAGFSQSALVAAFDANGGDVAKTLAAAEAGLASGTGKTKDGGIGSIVSEEFLGMVVSDTPYTGVQSAYYVLFDAGEMFISEAQDSYWAKNPGFHDITFASPTASSLPSIAASDYTGGSAWLSVPEPTSGLLMLLGIAGLALKRKRA